MHETLFSFIQNKLKHLPTIYKKITALSFKIVFHKKLKNHISFYDLFFRNLFKTTFKNKVRVGVTYCLWETQLLSKSVHILSVPANGEHTKTYTYLSSELSHKIICNSICILYVSVFCYLHLYHLQMTITREY